MLGLILVISAGTGSGSGIVFDQFDADPTQDDIKKLTEAVTTLKTTVDLYSKATDTAIQANQKDIEGLETDVNAMLTELNFREARITQNFQTSNEANNRSIENQREILIINLKNNEQ